MQHCSNKCHESAIAKSSLYQSLDELIADGLELTADKFASAAEMNYRHHILMIVAY